MASAPGTFDYKAPRSSRSASKSNRAEAKNKLDKKELLAVLLAFKKGSFSASRSRDAALLRRTR